MSIQENVQIVKDLFAAMGRGDKQGLLALSAEDIEWIIPGEDWPLAGTHRGHAGLKGLLQTVSAAQFRYINRTVKRCLRQRAPVISVDTKKKELLGNYDNAGQQLLPAKQPRKVQGHDFPSPEVPRAYPYGIYDVGRNAGFVNVGTDHDTGAFAVASIRGWWRHEGKRLYPKARKLLITADAGGSNGWRLRLWKLEWEKFADESGLGLSVCHFPPATSKWNKIEHRLFSFISSNWRGEPLRDYETIVNLIAETTTAKGLTVTCRLDRRKYPAGRKVTAEEMKQLNIYPGKFHGEWNYLIKPHPIKR